jgi:YaiO family outer membrane protein
MHVLRRRAVLTVWLLVLGSRSVVAQDTLQLARAEAVGGKPEAAIARLITHLDTAPDDDDARVLLGTVYSWSKRYEDARRELQRVVQRSPRNIDALAALANVELWSGNPAAAEAAATSVLTVDHTRVDVQLTLARALQARGRTNEARQVVDRVLSHTPGDEAALELRRALGADRPWMLETAYTYDDFDDDSGSWQELEVTVKRETRAGAVLGRVTRADRFSVDDEIFEIEMYPRLGGRRYGYVNAGWSADAELFPEYRFAAELFQPLPGAFEVSFGYRRLGFDVPAAIYTPSVSKYIGDYLMTGRLFITPDSLGTTTSYQLLARRYLHDGVSHVGVRLSQGSVLEDIRDVNDALILDSTGILGDLSLAVASRLQLTIIGGFSSEERANREDVKHLSLRTALGVRF